MSDNSLMAGCLVITAGVVLFNVVLPPVALAHCLFADNGASRLRRGLWAAVVVLLWPWGSLAYGGFGSRARPLQVVAAAFLLFQVWIFSLEQGESRMVARMGGPAPVEEYPASSEAGAWRRTAAWNEETRAPGWGNYVKGVAWSGDGERLLVGRDQTLEVRAADSGRLLSTLERLPANENLAGWLTGRWLGRGDTVALSPDGRFALAEEGDVTIRTWLGLWVFARQLAQGDARLAWWELDGGGSGFLAGHRTGITAIAFRGDGRQAVTAGRRGTVRVWDLDGARRLATLKAHPSGVRALAVSHSGRLALTGGQRPVLSRDLSGILRLWDLDEGRELRSLDGHEDRLVAVAFTADDRQGVSASRDDTFRWWDLETGAEVRCVRARALGDRTVLSRDARRAVTGWSTVEIWDLDRGEVVDAVDLRGVGDEGRAFALSADGDRLAVGTKAGAVLVYDRLP